VAVKAYVEDKPRSGAVQLGSADYIRRSGEKVMIANLLNYSRNNGRFPDIDGTPFPSDANLMRGVQISLTFEGSLQEAFNAVGADGSRRPQATKYSICDDLIIHIVDLSGKRFFQVQQLVPDEGARTILKAGHQTGVGNFKTTIGAVHGDVR